MGARGDFEQATNMATTMVTVGGLSDKVGPRALAASYRDLSEDLKRKVDEEVDLLLRTALDVARATLRSNRKLHAAVAEALLERETLDSKAFSKLVEQHPVEAARL